MARQDANAASRRRRSYTARTRPLSRSSTPATRSDPRRSTQAGEPSSPASRTIGRASPPKAQRCRPGSAPTGRRRQWRAGRGARRQLGRSIAAIGRQDQGEGRATRAAPDRDGDVQQATRDSVRALMMIRAYRMRGHLHADLDPLGLEPPERPRRTRPRLLRLHRGRLRPPDLHRQRARASNSRPSREMLEILQRTYCGDARRRVHAHLRSRGEGLDPGAHRGPRQGIAFTPKARRRSSTS